MNDFLRDAIRAYHTFRRATSTDPAARGERILPEVTPSLAAFMHELLLRRGVEIRLGAV
jgi:hypothetical protein